MLEDIDSLSCKEPLILQKNIALSPLHNSLLRAQSGLSSLGSFSLTDKSVSALPNNPDDDVNKKLDSLVRRSQSVQTHLQCQKNYMCEYESSTPRYLDEHNKNCDLLKFDTIEPDTLCDWDFFQLRQVKRLSSSLGPDQDSLHFGVENTFINAKCKEHSLKTSKTNPEGFSTSDVDNGSLLHQYLLKGSTSQLHLINDDNDISSQTVKPQQTQVNEQKTESTPKMKQPAFITEVTVENLDKIPLDEEGELTSVGSIKHADGTCRPCAFSNHPKKKNCINGIYCNFCHFKHPKKKKPKQPKTEQQQQQQQQQQQHQQQRMVKKVNKKIASELQQSIGSLISNNNIDQHQGEKDMLFLHQQRQKSFSKHYPRVQNYLSRGLHGESLQYGEILSQYPLDDIRSSSRGMLRTQRYPAAPPQQVYTFPDPPETTIPMSHERLYSQWVQPLVTLTTGPNHHRRILSESDPRFYAKSPEVSHHINPMFANGHHRMDKFDITQDRINNRSKLMRDITKDRFVNPLNFDARNNANTQHQQQHFHYDMIFNVPNDQHHRR